MRALLLTSLLVLPLAAPLAFASGAVDGAVTEIWPIANVVAGKQGISVWGKVAWAGEFPGHYTLALRLDGAELARATYWNAGEVVAVDANVPAEVSGDHTFSLVIDPDDALAETNESNNARSFSVFIHPAPFYDIAPLRLGVPRYVFAGIPFEATGHMRVTGQPETGGTFGGDGTMFETRLSIDGEPVCCRMEGNLWPGEWDFTQWTLTLGQGMHSYTMTADWDNSSYETDETNNVVSGWFYVLAAPADATVRILDIEHPTLRTDLGPIGGHPARRIAHVEACNHGAMAIPQGGITVTLSPTDGALLGGDSQRTLLADAHALDWLAPGACKTYHLEYGLVVVGDYVVTASVTAVAQVDTSNDVASRSDFLVLGGAGGRAL